MKFLNIVRGLYKYHKHYNMLMVLFSTLLMHAVAFGVYITIASLGVWWPVLITTPLQMVLVYLMFKRDYDKAIDSNPEFFS